MNQRWAPVPIHLLQKSNSKGGRDEVFASAEVSNDRVNNIERSARDYARRWAWSPGSVLRFLSDSNNFIDFNALNSNGTPETLNNGDSEHNTEQRQNRKLSNTSRTETEQSLSTDGTHKAYKYGSSLVVVEQERNTDGTVTEQLFNKEKKKEDICPFSPSKALFDLWNETVLGTPLPQINKLSDERRKKCGLRMKERSLHEWAMIFRRMADTPFLCGQGRDGWIANFDWIIKNADQADLLLEGKYDRTGGSSRPSDSRYNEIFAGA